ncbi:hypothetical protein Rhe02_04570 [Rhizocola hellebori]|uniref:DUF35 domain-containing protein n=1 Tax=Rhizocola hellebori TaxID=1392758 RepID=A0A8J3Q370_9ACTN|nr:zinc ribbon domain-containing protein [Rhizocola hellebori]GIH02390.1 hypothetical protein Rhe02_04570 [Rhizocola hellebori]
MTPEDHWWQEAAQHRLVLQHCSRCGHLQHYPRALCTSCGGTTLGWVQASGEATLDSFTVIHRDPVRVLARVRLAEGPILLTHLVGVGNPRCDQPVRLTWQGDLPVFTEVDDGL